MHSFSFSYLQFDLNFRSSQRAQLSEETESMRSRCTVSPENIGKMHLQTTSNKTQREGAPNWSAGQATRRGITI